MTLELRVTQLEGVPTEYRAVLLCNGDTVHSEKVATPAKSLFLMRQFLLPRCNGVWQQLDDVGKRRGIADSECGQPQGQDTLLTWLSGGFAGSMSAPLAREVFNWLDGDPEAIHAMCNALAQRLRGTQYDIRG